MFSLEVSEILLNLARHSSTASLETEAWVLIFVSEEPLLLLECMEILLKCMEVLWLWSLSSPLSL